MSCRGSLYALTDLDVANLRSRSEADRVDYVNETIAARDHETPWCAETDKAWDAIQRCFGDGLLDARRGHYPLNHIILGGEALYSRADYILWLKTPTYVRDIAAAIPLVMEHDFRSRFFAINPDAYNLGMPLTEEEFAGTWAWFCGLVEFYQHAAAAGRWVLFAVDQ